MYPVSIHREYRYYIYRERKVTYGGRERKRTFFKKEDASLFIYLYILFLYTESIDTIHTERERQRVEGEKERGLSPPIQRKSTF